MERVVAQKGTKLVEGVHKSYMGGLAITIKQANGLVREVPWDEEDGATPILIETMILDLEIENPELREATRRHCLNFLEGWVEVVGDPEEAYDAMPLSKLYSQAEAFIAGYETALVA